ncbi:MAG: alpha/beta hydrolase [Planctomycetes bacterium]|nr:alpha/beta hydrolase [Planctomycetota bacterium]
MPRPPLPPPVPFAAVPPVTLESVTAHGGVLAAGDERVRFRRWGGTDAGGPPRPIVVLVPILAGGEDLLDGVARRLVDHGFDVAACERAGAALRPPQRALELDDLFARTVRHQRILLQWLRSAPPPPATFVLGLSMGGMVAAVVAAAEPSLDGVAICLSGADLGGLVVRSSEPRVRRWVEWRRSEDGIGDGELTWELRQYLRYEPLAFAAAVAAPKVLFVGAALDTVVPPRHQDLLWEALGRPGRLTVALGHYTAAAAIDPILGAAAAHFRACAPAAAAP